MSKKNRRQAYAKKNNRQPARPAARTRAETTRTCAAALRAAHHPSSLPPETLSLLPARDGYTNQSAFLGAASPQMAEGTFVRSNLTWNQELLTTVYRLTLHTIPGMKAGSTMITSAIPA